MKSVLVRHDTAPRYNEGKYPQIDELLGGRGLEDKGFSCATGRYFVQYIGKKCARGGLLVVYRPANPNSCMWYGLKLMYEAPALPSPCRPGIVPASKRGT